MSGVCFVCLFFAMLWVSHCPIRFIINHFARLLLPDYGSDYEKLTDLLGRAILECEGFGLQ